MLSKLKNLFSVSDSRSSSDKEWYYLSPDNTKKTIFTSSSQDQAIEWDKTQIKDGDQLGDLIDQTYGDTEARDRLLSNLPATQVFYLLFKDKKFLLRAAQKLSYASLEFLRRFEILGNVPSIFTTESEIVQLFIQNLERCSDSGKVKQILKILLDFADDEVEMAILKSNCPQLAKVLFEIQTQPDKKGVPELPHDFDPQRYEEELKRREEQEDAEVCRRADETVDYLLGLAPMKRTKEEEERMKEGQRLLLLFKQQQQQQRDGNDEDF